MFKPMKDKDRKLAQVANLLVRGISKSQIAKSVGISRQTVDNWIKQYDLSTVKVGDNIKTAQDVIIAAVQSEAITDVILETNEALKEFETFDKDTLNLLKSLKSLINHVTNKAIEAMRAEIKLKGNLSKVNLKDIKVIVECVEKIRALYATIADSWDVKRKQPKRIEHDFKGVDISRMSEPELVELKGIVSRLDTINDRYKQPINPKPTEPVTEQ